MTAPFDFQALAARAGADNPDEALLSFIEEDRTHTRRWNRAVRASKGESRAVRAALRERLADEWRENRARLASTRPVTPELDFGRQAAWQSA